MVIGDSGIFGKASKAKEETIKAEALEDIKLKIVEAQANNDGKATLSNIVETLTSAQDEYKVITKTKTASLTNDSVTTNVDSADSILVTNQKYGKEVEVTKNLEISLTGTYGGENGSGSTGGTGNGGSSAGTVENKTLAGLTTGYTSKNPVIPGGFTTVDTQKAEWKYTDENKTEVSGWNDGLVIKDGEGNEFVWVPCSESNYAKINWGDSYKNNSWDGTITTAEKEQITKYGGFYVARYEAGSSNVKLTSGKKIGDETLSNWENDSYVVAKTTQDSKPTSKKGEIPYFHADYTTAMVMSSKMYEDSNTVNSNLITGTQWDVMINWMNDNSTTDKSALTTNCTWGNYNNTELSNVTGKYCIIDANGTMTSAWQTASWTGDTKKPKGSYLLTTGSTEDVNKKNIYDVAGNLWEWTNEMAGGTVKYMIRGASFLNGYSDRPACYRVSITATGTSTNYGFRPVLYVKQL